MVFKHSDDTIPTGQVFLNQLRRFDWTSCLTHLESTFLLLGYLVADIFVNKMLNSHVGPTRLHEEFLCDKLFDWAFGDDEDDLKRSFVTSK